MRRTCILALAVLVTACAATPAKRYYDAATAYNSVVETLVAYRRAGRIDDESYRRISPVLHAVDAALDQWDLALKNADPSTGEVDVPRAVVLAVMDGLNQLILWQAKFSTRKAVQ